MGQPRRRRRRKDYDLQPLKLEEKDKKYPEFFMDAEEVAELFEVEVKQINQWQREGYLKAYRMNRTKVPGESVTSDLRKQRARSQNSKLYYTERDVVEFATTYYTGLIYAKRVRDGEITYGTGYSRFKV